MSQRVNVARLVYWSLATGFALLSVYATVQLGRGATPTLSWVGLLLAAGAPLAGILTHRDTAQRPPLLWTAFSGLGLAITMTLSHRYGETAGQIHIWAGAALTAWFLWVRWLRKAGGNTQ